MEIIEQVVMSSSGNTDFWNLTATLSLSMLI